MDTISTLDLGLFLLSTFAGSLVAGLAGFAFALIAAGVWLHILPAAQVTALIVGFALVIQGYSVWTLRRAVKVSRLIPFVLGGAIGVPIGVFMLNWIPPADMKVAVGVVLITYSLYGLTRPALPTVRGGGAVDGVIGVLNGILGGATGLGGIIATVWCGLRGWPKDEQRAVFQPVTVATFLMAAICLGSSGVFDRATGELFALGLPVALAGTWTGLKLYGRLPHAAFQKAVLVLLLLSGTALLW